MRNDVVCAVIFGLFSCATVSKEAARTPPDDLQKLSRDYWEERSVSDPLSATYLGDRRFDFRLPDLSPEENTRHRRVLQSLLERMRVLAIASMSPSEQMTAQVLENEIETELSEEVCHLEWWRVDQMSGPQVSFAEIPTYHTVKEPAHLESLLARYRAMPAFYDTHVQNLRKGLAHGYVAARINVEKVIAQIEMQLSVPPEKSPYVEGVALPQNWPDAQKEDARRQLQKVVTDGIFQSLRRYADFLRKDVLPRSRFPNVGVSEVPDGETCYQVRTRSYTGTLQTAEALHQLGLSEVARLEKEMEALFKDAGHAGTLKEYLSSMKNRPEAYLPNSQALVDYNRALLARAYEVLPKAFGRLPKTPLEVREIEAFRAKESPAGYYYNAPTDGSRPAYYYLNTWQPSSRPLYNMAALAFHEGVPGHHLQIALANENTAIPDFQRQLGPTAFVEGWALYAERLAAELGLYQTLDEKLGALNYEMWRAVRLVVDTGIHSKGWTREKALSYFAAKTTHSEQEAVAEVERYIVWPGQALAYKVGQLEILAIRQYAREKLGAAFDLRAFHDRLLSHGAVPLSAARKDIEDWVAAQLHQTK